MRREKERERARGREREIEAENLQSLSLISTVALVFSPNSAKNSSPISRGSRVTLKLSTSSKASLSSKMTNSVQTTEILSNSATEIDGKVMF